MIRLALIAALFAAAAGVGMWLFTRGADNARTDQLERTLEDATKANDGAANPGGCLGSATPPTDAVPCVFLKPKLEALRAGILAHPETAEAVATPAADIVLGSEAVCT